MSFDQIKALVAAAERRQEQDANTIGELHVELLWARADIDGLQKEVKMLREIISAQQPAAAPVVQLCLAEKKRAYHLKNRIACACGGVSSNTESTKKIHEAGKQHQNYLQQQAAAAAAPSSEDKKRERKNELMREKNRSMVKACPCGGKTNCDKMRRERHERTQMHQDWVMGNDQYSDANE